MTVRRTTWYSLACVLVMTFGACGIVQTAKDAAKEWWSENSPTVITDVTRAATTYWEGHKSALVAEATTAAVKIMDAKLEAQRQATIGKLLAAGYTTEQMDTNHDGTVDEAELAAFLKANPTALLYTGAAGVAFLALWYLRQMAQKKAQQSADPPPTPTPIAPGT